MRLKNLEIEVEGVYEPREDSFLLAEVVEREAFGDVLDMGTGSGIQALVAAKNAKRVVGVDVNGKAVEVARKNAERNHINNVEFFRSDLFENVSGKFDLIIFNPPYLPEEVGMYEGSEQWAGGKSGREVIERFANKVKNYLKDGGKILIVISSLTGLEEVKKIFAERGFSVKVVREQKIPWETLYVLKMEKLKI